MLIVTHDTLRNPAVLSVRQLPRKFFGRVSVFPKGPIGIARWLRIRRKDILQRAAAG